MEGRDSERLLVTGMRTAMRIRQLTGCVVVVRDDVMGSVLLH